MDIVLTILMIAVIIFLGSGLLAYVGMLAVWIDDGYSRWNDNDDRKN